MRNLSFILLIALAFAIGVFASEDPTEVFPHVLDLTEKNFNKEVNGAKAVLVEFYAPWCGHCKKLSATYSRVGEAVANDPLLKNRILIAKVNADEHSKLGERFGVRGYPTLKFFARGKPVTQDDAIDYNEARSEEAMLKFLRAQVNADRGFGRIDSLNEAVESFLAASDKAAAISEIRSAAAAVEAGTEEADNVSIYIKVAEKVVEKGDKYLSMERARVEKMLSGRSIAAAKAVELSKKIAVLDHYLGQ